MLQNKFTIPAQVLHEYRAETKIKDTNAQLDGIDRELNAARQACNPLLYPAAYVAALRKRRAALRKSIGLPPIQNARR